MTPTSLAWNKATESADGVPAVQPTTKSQRLCDDLCCKAASLHLTNTAPDVASRARHYASLHETSETWLYALLITSIGFRLSNDSVRIAVCLRLGLNQCQPLWDIGGCYRDIWFGMQEKRRPSSTSQQIKRRHLACTNPLTYTIHEGTRRTEQV